jgi:hypothetical protein
MHQVIYFGAEKSGAFTSLESRFTSISSSPHGSESPSPSAMSGLRIVSDIDLPSGVETPRTDFSMQLSQEEENESSTEVTWGE